MKTEIEKLQEKHQKELDELLSSQVYNTKTGVKCFRSDDTIFFSPESEDEIGRILSTLQPYVTGHKIDHKKTEYLASPYKIDSSSGMRDLEIVINYEQINGREIRIAIPLTILSQEFKDKFLATGRRKVSSTELHYFGGVSRKEINNITLPTVEFKTHKTLTWYKSSYTLMDVDVINDIINYFNK